MKKILITGANSYIGKSVEQYLSIWPDKYLIETIDMVDGNWRTKSFSEYFTVFHVAGIAHVDVSKITEEKKDLYYKINTNLSIETAKKAKADGVKQFIFMSSSIVYGDPGMIAQEKIIIDSTPPSPSNFYGDSKYKAEQGLQLLQSSNFNVVILRPPMIYGKGSKGNYTVLVKLAKYLPIFPYIQNERSMLYIENLVVFVKLIIDNEEHGIFFPQNAEYSNTSELIRMIAREHGKKVVLIRGLSWVVKCLSLFSGNIKKAFGNFIYSKSISQYKTPYQIVSLEESIRRAELP